MASESLNDKYSIKNLLFTRAIPNYVIPVPTQGHKVFSCIDCGDRFLFESSLDYHVNRKSVKITYNCKHCNQVKIFNNRCNMLFHIRSHAFKTVTINVSDLKIEPLPLNEYPLLVSAPSETSTPAQEPPKKIKQYKSVCVTCNKNITDTGTADKDRKKHFMEYTNKVFACPVCMFTLPTDCALKAHLRIHMKTPPFFCPECGLQLSSKNIIYPYNHDCEGFNMMRATARSRCPIAGCQLFHPSVLKQHIKENHLKVVYKCPLCNIACFNQTTMEKHLKAHSNIEAKAITFYQCEMCPGRLVLEKQVDNHLQGHNNYFVYPCWICGSVFSSVKSLGTHSINIHNGNKTIDKNMSFEAITSVADSIVYRVVKRCDKCNRSFKYKCRYDQIHILPNQCPHKCSNKTSDLTENFNNDKSEMTCGLCQSKTSQKWEDIKEHFSKHHQEHQCVDVQVVLQKIDITKNVNRKRKNRRNNIKIKIKPFKPSFKTKNRQVQKMSNINNEKAAIVAPVPSNNNNLICQCGETYDDQESLEKHVVTHRDPCMAYQCMECGKCLVVKRSFSMHLLLEHNIQDVENYINTKQCYNESALASRNCESQPLPPLRENQCKICREQFENSHDLEKHFRIHGMAFLLQNSSTKVQNPSP